MDLLVEPWQSIMAPIAEFYIVSFKYLWLLLMAAWYPDLTVIHGPWWGSQENQGIAMDFWLNFQVRVNCELQIQWALPDLNRECQMPVGTAGPQRRAPDVRHKECQIEGQNQIKCPNRLPDGLPDRPWNTGRLNSDCVFSHLDYSFLTGSFGAISFGSFGVLNPDCFEPHAA